MTEILGGIAFLLLIAAQIFAVAVLNGNRYSRDGKDKSNADAAVSQHSTDGLDAATSLERHVDQCRTQRSRYLAVLFRQTSPE